MAEPGNWFTIPSMSEKHLTEKEILGKTTTSQNVTLRLEFSVAPAANQPPGLPVCEISARDELI